MDVCGEIQYNTEEGMIHSDICVGHEMDGFGMDQEQREFLHACLDEWLNKSNGTGGFWIGNPEFMVENFQPEKTYPPL